MASIMAQTVRRIDSNIDKSCLLYNTTQKIRPNQLGLSKKFFHSLRKIERDELVLRPLSAPNVFSNTVHFNRNVFNCTKYSASLNVSSMNIGSMRRMFGSLQNTNTRDHCHNFFGNDKDRGDNEPIIPGIYERFPTDPLCMNNMNTLRSFSSLISPNTGPQCETAVGPLSSTSMSRRPHFSSTQHYMVVRSLSNGRHDDEKNSKMRFRVGALSAAALVLAGKAKWVLVGLKFAKVMPALSMIFTTGAYAMFFGLPFAVGMVGQLFIHESGHWLVMKRYGIATGPMTFIPFFGAFIQMKDRPKDVAEEAMVAFGGPVVGGLTALGISIVGVATNSQLLISLADFGFFINLFNLFPMGHLDGGRIVGAVSSKLLLGGLVGAVGLALSGFPANPLYYILIISGGFTCYDRFFGSGTHKSYYNLHPETKSRIMILYLALLSALFFAMSWNVQYKKSIRTLRMENPNVEMGDTGRKLEQYANDWMDDSEQMYERKTEEDRRFFDDRHF